MAKRFIELALHAGCSRKLGAGALGKILSSLSNESDKTGGLSTWLDYGRFDLGDQSLVSNVDIVLPMVLSPADFGEIVVSHVLSDIYAAAAKPLFALNILGISNEADSENQETVELLLAAQKKLVSCNVALVGGHTLGDQQDYSYGLAAVGIVEKGKLVANDGATPGDLLVLTKPLGTSVASGLWKNDPALENEFADVLESMKMSNAFTSSLLVDYAVSACTDITGFGFLGHTHNLLKASKVSATVFSEKLPVFESILPFIDRAHPTRIWSKNFDYVNEFVDFRVPFSSLFEKILFDAQVSGGLLVSLPQSRCNDFVQILNENSVKATIIGEVTAGSVGRITIV